MRRKEEEESVLEGEMEGMGCREEDGRRRRR